jgi:hypothetical protein
VPEDEGGSRRPATWRPGARLPTASAGSPGGTNRVGAGAGELEGIAERREDVVQHRGDQRLIVHNQDPVSGRQHRHVSVLPPAAAASGLSRSTA